MSTALEPNTLARRMALWQIDDELQTLMGRAQDEENETGSITVATEEALRAYFDAALQKVDRISEFLKTIKVLQEAKVEEKHRLDERGRALENTEKRVKQMLIDFMQARGITQIKGKLNTISLCNNSQASLAIADSTKVPAQFWRMQLTVTLDWWNRLMDWRRGSNVRSTSAELLEDLFTSMTEMSKGTIDEAAIRERLSHGDKIEGCELKFGQHIRTR